VAKRRDGNIFIERSIKSALGFFKEAIFQEDIAKSRGLLQSVDPRIKIIVLAALLLATCLVRDIYWLSSLYILSLILSSLSGIRILFFIKRVWFFIPIFALFIAIPAVFMHGLLSASIFVLRVATCVSFVVLTTITTRHNQLLKSMRYFGVPNIFVQVLDMTYRYIFLLIGVFEDMHLSLKSRVVEKFDSSKARHWIASRISFLFKRSMKMSEDVYLAMVARGHTGDIKKYGK
jgi:cobalt/nickel transport system permease protein